MPARSTPFQKLVAHLQAHLGSGASVQESAMLRHRLTGEEREVDVVVRSKVGEHSVVVSLECIDQSRPADSTWVEQMKTKHDHLETDRLVLVSSSGFYEPAQTLAMTLGICAYTPQQAVRQDWMRIIGDREVHVARFDDTPLTTWLLLQKPEGPTFVEAGDVTQIRRPDNGATGTLRDVVMFALNSRVFSLPAMDGQPKDGEATIQFDFSLEVPILALDAVGREHPVTQLRVKAKAVRRTSPILIRAMIWNGTPAAFGHGETALGKTVVTFIEEPGKLDARIVADGRELDVQVRPDIVGERGKAG